MENIQKLLEELADEGHQNKLVITCKEVDDWTARICDLGDYTLLDGHGVSFLSASGESFEEVVARLDLLCRR